MCVLSIKVLIRKKSGNLFNDPRNYVRLSVFSPNVPKKLDSCQTDWKPNAKYSRYKNDIWFYNKYEVKFESY